MLSVKHNAFLGMFSKWRAAWERDHSITWSIASSRTYFTYLRRKVPHVELVDIIIICS
jgi:hypothetical protein